MNCIGQRLSQTKTVAFIGGRVHPDNPDHQLPAFVLIHSKCARTFYPAILGKRKIKLHGFPFQVFLRPVRSDPTNWILWHNARYFYLLLSWIWRLIAWGIHPNMDGVSTYPIVGGAVSLSCEGMFKHPVISLFLAIDRVGRVKVPQESRANTP